MKKLFYHSLLFLNQVKSISLFVLLILCYSVTAKGQAFNQFLGQNQFDAKTSYPLVFLNPQAVIPQASTPLWENIQTIMIDQPVGPNILAKPVSLNLDQVRNGSATDPVVPPAIAPWVNGNAGASNAHYAEGYSIPYRLVVENLVGTGPRSVDIEWDTRQSNSSAIDFITNFDMIDYPAGSHVTNFGHVQEVLNPLSESGTWAQSLSGLIPIPDFTGAPGAVTTLFQAIQSTGDLGKLTLYNATNVTMSYISQSSVIAQAGSTRLRIFFTNTQPNVIISWGGHIAKGENCWGAGNSASAVSGSPYHTRLIQWDPDGNAANGVTSVGNQDRSLSADAVQDPPICDLTGPSSVECSSTSTFNSGVDASDLNGVSFDWVLLDDNTENANTCGASIVDETHVDYVTINSGSVCNCSYRVRFKLIKNGLEISHCDKLVTITDSQAPTITCPSAPTSPIDCPATPVFGDATATDNCGTPTVTSADNDVQGTCVGTYTRTRKWTARDVCGNTSTCSQSVTVRDITAPVITCPSAPTSPINCPNVPSFGNATATDACSTASVTSSDSDAPGTCAGTYTRTRKWTATDACGNTSTCSQSVIVRDVTPPTITCPSPPTSPINCPATPVFGDATATDACDQTVSITSSDNDVAGTCGYTRTRTWKATDDCGNTSTCSQSVVVTDNTPPTITNCPANIVIECDASLSSASLGSATATDACSTPTVTSSDGSATPKGCVSVIVRRWTARDACGNTSTCSQTITKRDHTGPVINCTLGTATDNCSPQGDITIYFNNGIWTAIDGSGNITTATADCSVQGSGLRANTSQVTEEQKEQQIVSEEKTIAPMAVKELAKNITVQAIPNPFNDRVRFIVTSPEAGYGSLDVMNMLGQKVKTVFQGQLNAGNQSFEMVLPQSRYSTLFYIFRINGKQVTGKLVQAGNRN